MSNLRIQVEDDDNYVNAEKNNNNNNGQYFAADQQNQNAYRHAGRPSTPNTLTQPSKDENYQRLVDEQPNQMQTAPLSTRNEIVKGSNRYRKAHVDEISEVSSSAAWLNLPAHEYPDQKPDGSTAEFLVEGGGLHLDQRINTIASASDVSNQVQLQMQDSRFRDDQVPSDSVAQRSFQDKNPRVAFDTFDSSIEERREEKLVFKYIQRMDFTELRQHLNTTKDKFNVTQIYDKSGYTPLHYAAYKNIEKACDILVEFILCGSTEDHETDGSMVSNPRVAINGGSGETHDQRSLVKTREARQQVLKTWLNGHSRGDDGFTALHFAAFHGNMSLVRLFVRNGADVHAQNRQGINMLHVSAQGDQPVSLAYFLEKGLDVNSLDLRKSTPLHWAAFSGAELTLNYIIAWGGDLDVQDSKGLTPLHLAVKAYKENRSTKGIKQLLVKGANRNALDFETKKPVDYVPLPEVGDKSIDPLVIEIRKLLRDEWSLLGDCLMIKSTFKKQRKSPFTLICYFVLMGLSFLFLELSSYQLLRVSGHSEWLLWSSQGLFGAAVLFCIIVWCSDPGVIKKDPDLNFVKLLDTLEASSLCPDCEVIRTPRCRHCVLCQRCVDRYDHHCPWVNNCIGKGNYGQFYIFVLLQSIYLFSVIIVSVIYFKLEFVDDVYAEYEDREKHPWHKYRRAAGILMSMVSVLFLVSVMFLCWLQTGNLCKGETTCERFAKTNYKALHAMHQEAMSMELSYDIAVKKRFSIMSVDANTNPSLAICGNITGMCCNQGVMGQKEILQRTQEAYQVETQTSCEGRENTMSDLGLVSHKSNRSTTAMTPLITKNNGESGKMDV